LNTAFLVLATFAVAPVAGWLVSRYPRIAGALALWPGLIAVFVAKELWTIDAAGGRVVEISWVPSLGLSLAFNLDGWGLLFALLISAIGALVVWYASAYLRGHPDGGRFYG
jgi:multicomponent Na+:H+ antiporter subunit A